MVLEDLPEKVAMSDSPGKVNKGIGADGPLPAPRVSGHSKRNKEQAAAAPDLTQEGLLHVINQV